MIKTPLTTYQARALALLMECELSGPEFRKALGVPPERAANFSRFLGRLRRVGYVVEKLARGGHGTRIYSVTAAGQEALARTFDMTLSGTIPVASAYRVPPPNGQPITIPPDRPDDAALAELKAAFEKVDAPFARHIARYLPRGEVQEEARQALDQLREAITAITRG
jgi:DNA-binding PadR family transcriptional regulator